jgi:RNA polymerase sigma-70 factor (ECF subfamily)
VDDVELVRRIAAGSRDAEADLVRRYAPRARLYGLRHLRDEERARDLAQSALLRVLEAARAGRIEEADKLDRFVLGTCRHVALKMRERDGRMVAVDAEALAAIPIEAAEPPGIDRTALMRCLAALDERAQRVVRLSFSEERPADEIGRLLGTTPGNVRVMRHRAVAALRDCLEARS